MSSSRERPNCWGSVPHIIQRTKPNNRQLKRRIVINISGDVYETYDKTLEQFPDTLLGNFDKCKEFYCTTTHQYFFNRSRLCFGAILYFYQSKGVTLSCPVNVDVADFEEECLFFQIPSDSINKMKVKRGILIEESDQEEDDEDKEQSQTPNAAHHRRSCTNRIWNLLENPESSTYASAFTLFSLFMVFVSVVVTCFETVTEFDHLPWGRVEFFVNVWFISELILRTIFCPNKMAYFKSTMTWLDVIAVVPYFITIAMARKQIDSFAFFRIVRFFKVMRLFRLSKHSKRLKIVGAIITSSLGDLQLLLLCLHILMIFGGSLMYFLEQSHPLTPFTSIPQSLWWGVQTITTVGYGDIVPVTEFGKLFAASFMLFGAVTISLPVLSIVAKFTLLYSRNT